MVLNRLLLAAIAGSMAATAAAAPARQTVVTCRNPASGTAWQLRIDYDRGTVNANAARIGDAEISWHDAADGANYTLDRRSGALTGVVASSTGGYFVHDQCTPETPR